MQEHESSARVMVCWNLLIGEGLPLRPRNRTGRVGAFVLTRTADSLLYGVARSDPAPSWPCCWPRSSPLPVRRALKLDPIQALRIE
ncbi:MAG TPA: hypothetical protein VLV83_16250 [Acidobacteriota bacterium]|nr:hypothetical protein [Acidobacteriota bacterium]